MIVLIFYCINNQLTSLEGCSDIQIGNKYFDCSNNQLTSLEGCPKNINDINFKNNYITTIKGLPDNLSFIQYNKNPIYNIIDLFRSYNEFKSLLDDYNYLRGNKIIKARFEQACLEIGIDMPEKIEGYTII